MIKLTVIAKCENLDDQGIVEVLSHELTRVQKLIDDNFTAAAFKVDYDDGETNETVEMEYTIRVTGDIES